MASIIETYYKVKGRKRKFFRQVNLLFAFIFICIIAASSNPFSENPFPYPLVATLWRITVAGLFYIWPVVYPFSIFMILFYRYAERKLEAKGYQRTTSVILISSGIILFCFSTILFFTVMGYYRGHTVYAGFLDYLMQTSDIRSLLGPLLIVGLLCMATSVIRLDLFSIKKNISEDILDVDL